MAKNTPARSTTSITEAEFVRLTLIFVGIVALAFAVYKLSDILLLVFGSILVAVILRDPGRGCRDRRRAGRGRLSEPAISRCS
jgi:hypothetical protein